MPIDQICYHKEAFALGMFATTIIYVWVEIIWGILKGEKRADFVFYLYLSII